MQSKTALYSLHFVIGGRNELRNHKLELPVVLWGIHNPIFLNSARKCFRLPLGFNRCKDLRSGDYYKSTIAKTTMEKYYLI